MGRRQNWESSMQVISVLQSRHGGVWIRVNFQAARPAVERDSYWSRKWQVAMERESWESSKVRKTSNGVVWVVVLSLLYFEELELAFLEHLSIPHVWSLPECPTPRTQDDSVPTSLWSCPHILLTGRYFCDQRVGNSPSFVPIFFPHSQFPMSLWYLLPSDTGNWVANPTTGPTDH